MPFCDVASTSLVKFHFCCVQEVFLCCVVAHVKGFWASVDSSCKSTWFREAERGFIGMCAGLWRRNQGLVLGGVVPRQQLLFQDFRAVLLGVDMPHVLSPHRKWNLRILALGGQYKFWRTNFSRHQQKRNLAGGVNKWEKGASGEMFLFSMEHLSKSEGIGYKCRKIQHLNRLFESEIRTVLSSVMYLTMYNGSLLLLGLDGWKVLFLAPAIKNKNTKMLGMVWHRKVISPLSAKYSFSDMTILCLLYVLYLVILIEIMCFPMLCNCLYPISYHPLHSLFISLLLQSSLFIYFSASTPILTSQGFQPSPAPFLIWFVFSWDLPVHA